MEGLLALSGITLLAYAVKAATGFGPALVVVSLGSLLVGPAQAVILAAFLDLVSGAAVLWVDRRLLRGRRWWRLALTMSAGAVAGGLLLGVLPTATLTRVVAFGILGFGIWMLVAPFLAPATLETGRNDDPSTPPRPADTRVQRPFLEHLLVGAGGVSGGLIGVGGPPLVLYFGSRLPKEAFRGLIVPILLAAAFARTATYVVSGQVDRETLLLLAVSLPALPPGIVLGNRLFQRFSERTFRIVVAILVTAAGLRLI